MARDEGMNPESRQGVLAAIEKHALRSSAAAGQSTQLRDGARPERAVADLVPLASDPDRRIPVVAELEIAHGELGGLIRARTRVVEKQQDGVVSTTLWRALVGRGQQDEQVRQRQGRRRHHERPGAVAVTGVRCSSTASRTASRFGYCQPFSDLLGPVVVLKNSMDTVLLDFRFRPGRIKSQVLYH